MPYQVKWKDGSVSDLSDADLANMPKEMEADIGDIVESKAPATGLDSAIANVRNAPATDQYMGKAYVPQPVTKAPNISEYVSNAYNYAAGEPQENPNAMGKIWKGAAHTVVDRPADLALGLAAPFVPLSAGGVVLATGTGALANAVNKMHLSGDAPSEYQTKSYGENLADNLVTGGVSGLAHGLGTIGSKITGKLASKVSSIAESNEVEAARVAAEKEAANKLVKKIGSNTLVDPSRKAEVISAIEELRKTNPNISIEDLTAQVKNVANMKILRSDYAEYLSKNSPVQLSADQVSDVDALKWYNTVMAKTPTTRSVLPRDIGASLAGSIIGHSVLGIPGAIAGFAAPTIWNASRPTLEKAAVDMARSPVLSASIVGAAKSASPATLFAFNVAKERLAKKK